MIHEVNSCINFEVCCENPEHAALTHLFSLSSTGTVSASTAAAAAELQFRTVFERLTIIEGLTGTLTASRLEVTNSREVVNLILEELHYRVKYRPEAVTLTRFELDYDYETDAQRYQAAGLPLPSRGHTSWLLATTKILLEDGFLNQTEKVAGLPEPIKETASVR